MAHSGFKTADDALAFIFSGKAVVTLTSAKTGTHYTYKIKAPADNPKMFFAQHLFGPDNAWNGDWSYLGYIHPSTFYLRDRFLSAGKKGKPDAASFKALDWALKHLSAGSIPEGLTIQHSDACGKCGRPLTDPVSVETGLGPVCRGAA